MLILADNEKLLNTKEAADLLGLKPCTLESWRFKGFGPTFIRCGRAIRYDRTDLIAFVQGQRRRSTSDTGCEVVR